ncbi:MAG: carbohydrate-binding family 9-like protein, partial [Planctomycetota bacterium]
MTAEDKTYIVKRATSKPDQTGNWDTGPWADANIDKIEVFSDTSSDHRPVTEFKLLYDDEAIYIHFRVQDKYVIALEEKNQSNVCRDACVEFFAWPKPLS